MEAKTTFQANQWQLFGGIINYYTFDPDVHSNFEFRPYLSIALKTKITGRIFFNQRLQSEWRNLYFSSTSNQHSIRLRYRAGIHISLSKKDTEKGPWKLRTESEWYILNNLQQKERYANSREISLTFIKEMKHDIVLDFGYRLEKLNMLFYTTPGDVHSVFVEFEF